MSKPAPEMVALARRRYLEGVPVERIRAETGMSRHQFYYSIEGKYPDGSGTPPSPLPRRHVFRHKKVVRVSRISRIAVVARLWSAAEAQVRDIEDRILRKEQQGEDRERDTRSFAVLAKTLRELILFDERKKAPQADHDDDDGLRNIDEFRRELVRRMDAVVAARTPGIHSEPENR
jgi:hypothetical protein